MKRLIFSSLWLVWRSVSIAMLIKSKFQNGLVAPAFNPSIPEG